MLTTLENNQSRCLKLQKNQYPIHTIPYTIIFINKYIYMYIELEKTKHS